MTHEAPIEVPYPIWRLVRGGRTAVAVVTCPVCGFVASASSPLLPPRGGPAIASRSGRRAVAHLQEHIKWMRMFPVEHGG